ncbi:site-specific integrase [Erythrobacter sp. SCSIO 43205]|uniref:site-specific integrase n=1 Tax=Erythrobacter sp. SCSIO 43205 TaxID=2779361 RepID=UPI001CA980C5|nr:site-specific integrase [Erythrobacter sp. SCSIO 43205]UAB78982.1 site-specific integrase [Erythrobacter sp. SCSIO 43205]
MAYALATKRSYYADVEAFEHWCVENRIEKPFPAQVETVCQFLEDKGQAKAPSTVQRRLYAIRKVHRLLRLPNPTYDEDINLAMRKGGSRSRRSARPTC